MTGATAEVSSRLGLSYSLGWGAAPEGRGSSVSFHSSPSRLLRLAHLVYVFVPYREGEGEAQGQFLVLHLMLVQEVRDALGDVVKELAVKMHQSGIGSGLGQQQPSPQGQSVPWRCSDL